MSSCVTCKHYGRLPESLEDTLSASGVHPEHLLTAGVCMHISSAMNDDSPLQACAFSDDVHGEGDGLLFVRHDFCCILHEDV